jgi:hypothetical protein
VTDNEEENKGRKEGTERDSPRMLRPDDTHTDEVVGLEEYASVIKLDPDESNDREVLVDAIEELLAESGMMNSSKTFAKKISSQFTSSSPSLSSPGSLLNTPHKMTPSRSRLGHGEWVDGGTIRPWERETIADDSSRSRGEGGLDDGCSDGSAADDASSGCDDGSADAAGTLKHQNSKHDQHGIKRVINDESLRQLEEGGDQNAPANANEKSNTNSALLCLDTVIPFGEVGPKSSKSVTLHLLALDEGLLQLDQLYLRDDLDGSYFRLTDAPCVFAKRASQ